MSKSGRVVVTGMDVNTSIGNGLEQFWENSLKQKIGYKVYQDEKICNGEKKILGKLFQGNSNRECEYDDEFGKVTSMAISSSKKAIVDAKIDISKFDCYRCGVCISNAISNTPYCEELFNTKNIGNTLLKTNRFVKGMFSFISFNVSKILGIHGESLVMSTGCTGGIDAIGYGFEAIKNGEMDLMICGGVEAPLATMTIKSFEAIGALAKGFEDNPETASRPFDIKRNGFILAEGVGILVLESLESATSRGARIYGEIVAFNTNNNAYHMTDLSVLDTALETVIKKSLEDANLNLNDIDYINAHGSSTKQNDLFEISTYKKVFGEEQLKEISISSTKSQIGHPLAAASAIETIHSLLALKYNIVPPTTNFSHHDFDSDIRISSKPYHKYMRHALTNANGFGGLHSVLVMSKIDVGGR